MRQLRHGRSATVASRPLRQWSDAARALLVLPRCTSRRGGVMAGMPHTMSDEWFRSSLWREKDRELFEAKLARAHKGNRAQYLRIKALSLAESGDKAARAAAGDLFERIFSEYPDDRLQVTMAHADKA